MCGVAGVVDFRDGARVERETIERMCALIAHRGPNHQGVHVREGAGIGHVRLTLTDLVTGQQPLANEDGTVWVTFNGEIYNFQDLREPLEKSGHRFRSNSDTEVPRPSSTTGRDPAARLRRLSDSGRGDHRDRFPRVRGRVSARRHGGCIWQRGSGGPGVSRLRARPR